MENNVAKLGYEYSPDGLREVKRGSGGTTHYVFEGTEPIFEKRITDSRVRSYVYALGKHLARVDGVIGYATAKVYYYHTDHLGSVKAVTDEAGKVVHKADYFAFGTQFIKNGDFEELHGFTGKEFDSDTGLYYYNARWYDSELGRFISEDPMGDPNNPNLYSYGANNPVNNADPTGNYTDSDGNEHYEDPVGPSGPVYAQPAPSGGGGSTSTPEKKPDENPNPGGGQAPGQGKESTITTYPDGNIKSQTIYNPDGSTQSQTNYYDNGSIKSQTNYNQNGTVGSKINYNKDGTVSSGRINNTNGKLQESFENYYDDQGHLTGKKQTIMNPNGSWKVRTSQYDVIDDRGIQRSRIRTQREYQYDNQGNLLGHETVNYRMTGDKKTYTTTNYYDASGRNIGSKDTDPYSRSEHLEDWAKGLFGLEPDLEAPDFWGKVGTGLNNAYFLVKSLIYDPPFMAGD